MKHNWSLTEELYRSFHRWPVIAVYFLVGCLVGWLLSFTMPRYYRAITQVYVALNPYRTYSDSNFLALARPKYSNIDDYKDWQMTQLEAVIYLDDFINETLERLQSQYPSWVSFSEADLRGILSADWRSAGTWSLIANASDPEIASQASATWSDVVVEKVKGSIEAARQTFMVDQDLQSLSNQLQAFSLRVHELETTKSSLERWKLDTAGLPSESPLEASMRWGVLSQVTRIAQFNPAWMTILERQPDANTALSGYLSWLDEVEILIDQDIKILQEQIRFAEVKEAELSQRYEAEADSSLGLSPNLEIERVEQKKPEIIRPATTFIMIGGTIGFLIWILTQLVMITRRRVDE